MRRTCGACWRGSARSIPRSQREMFDASGNLHRFVNVYVNDHGIDDLQGLETPLDREDEVAVIPAMAGGATATRSRFTPEQAVRYSRHIILPEIGGVGQRKLLNAKVVLIGAGGLGSPTALYLAAAGVGTMGIVDFDTVDLSNLHRQIIHGHANIGRPKVDSARDQLADVNPDVKVVAHTEALTVRERDGDPRPVRHHRQRLRQLRHPLPGERRGVPAEEAAGRRQHLPLRGPGDGLHAGQGLLPLPLPGAAAAGRGPELRRGRRAGRAAGHDRRSSRRPRRSS